MASSFDLLLPGLPKVVDSRNRCQDHSAGSRDPMTVLQSNDMHPTSRVRNHQ